jgi:hypothetical protein
VDPDPGGQKTLGTGGSGSGFGSGTLVPGMKIVQIESVLLA